MEYLIPRQLLYLGLPKFLLILFERRPIANIPNEIALITEPYAPGMMAQ